jgi:hypothetical protein
MFFHVNLPRPRPTTTDCFIIVAPGHKDKVVAVNQGSSFFVPIYLDFDLYTCNCQFSLPFMISALNFSQSFITDLFIYVSSAA